MSTTNVNTLSLSVNGQEAQVVCDATQSLADVLREDLGLTGTKIGCRTGECGACTVLIDGMPMVSCLIPVASVQGHGIETIEQLANKDDFQSLVQAILESGGVQCGFCTPGIMVTLWAWLQDQTLFNGEIEAALKNNLCRCTGYQSIIAAVNKVISTEGMVKHEDNQIAE